MKNRSWRGIALVAFATTTPVFAQVGDECTTAPAIGMGSATYSNVGYTNSPATSTPFPPGQADRWFTFTPTVTQVYEITTCNIAVPLDTTLNVYEGSCSQLQYVMGNDDYCGFFGVSAGLQTTLNAGTTYYLQIGTWSPTGGSFQLSIAFGSSSVIVVPGPTCSNTTLAFYGRPSVGGALTTHVQGASGITLIGAGLNPAANTFCGCLVGHDWVVSDLGSSTIYWVPPISSLIGFQFYVQGADFQSFAGCPGGGVNLTETYTVTVHI